MDLGREWFWQNYDVCLRWQERHHHAYWRSRALALEYERNALLDYIETISKEERFIVSDSEAHFNSSCRKPKSREFVQFCANDNIYSSKKHKSRGRNRSRTFQRSSLSNRSTSYVRNNSEVETTVHQETEVDKDVIEFFKQSMLHKMELKEKRKAYGDSDSTDSPGLKKRQDCHHAVTEDEMNLLYGKKSAMIRGMETAMQLSFERNCDKLNPVYWPVIPLKS